MTCSIAPSFVLLSFRHLCFAGLHHMSFEHQLAHKVKFISQLVLRYLYITILYFS